MTLEETKINILADPEHWLLHLMEFVDAFRRNRSSAIVARPFQLTDKKLDALLASTAEYLCNETGIAAPAWLGEVPASPEPWFVSGLESLKAIALAESPAYFRVRKIFVLENFLSRA